MREFPSKCRGYRPYGRRKPCRKRACCVEGQANAARIRAKSFLWGLRRNSPAKQPYLNITVNLPALLDWSVLESVKSATIRKLRDKDVSFLLAVDFATTGLHLHVLIFDTTPAAGLSKQPSVVSWLEEVAWRFWPDANVNCEPIRSSVGSILYTLGVKPGEKCWVLPMALKRKRLVAYSPELLGKALWMVEKEYVREVALGREPTLRPPDGWFADHASRVLTSGLQRSAPLIEAMDGPLWTVIRTR